MLSIYFNNVICVVDCISYIKYSTRANMTYHNNIAEKRVDERVKLAGYVLNFIDIHLDSSVIITDISTEGLRMTKVPRKLAYKETPSKITVSGKLLSGCYKLTIMPCWRKKMPFIGMLDFIFTDPLNFGQDLSGL
ncbi:MAG: hypothetical protein D3903_11840 [Candidatus Electrothrix sp. GM3_4]|nr:hypothetical protein [Candidatus Electrothrix sp. GM3_4]